VPKFGREFLAMSEDAIQKDPTDIDLWEVKGAALALQNRHSEALAAYQSGLALAPNREALVLGAAQAAQNSNRLEDAVRYWRQGAEINPFNSVCHFNLAVLAVHQADWTNAKKHSQLCLNLDPSDVTNRKIWVQCWLHEGNRARAREEFAKIEALQPPDLAELQAWFQQQVE
jgi:tetratricopeptide (TPR) repeat protein